MDTEIDRAVEPERGPDRKVLIGLGVLLVLWIVGKIVGWPPTPTSATSATSPSAARPAAAYDLALIASRGHEVAGGYRYVEGQVMNISGRPLESVLAIATWYDQDGNFIKTDKSLIEYRPILPEQRSPFRVISSGNPLMSRYSVDFKRFDGALLRVDDQRK